jgi:hypothetical protein
MIRCDFIRSIVPDPCPRKRTFPGHAVPIHECQSCKCDILERVAHMIYDAKMTKEDAERIARENAVSLIPGQCPLL